MDLQQLENDFMEASAKVEEARQALHLRAEVVILATRVLDGAKMEALKSGQVDGKNETERKGQLAELTHGESEKLANAEKAERYARFCLENAQAEFDLLRYRLRIAELMNK